MQNCLMKVLFYSDYDVFGGHEVMAAHLANSLSRHVQVFFAYRSPEFKNKLVHDIVQIHAPTRTRRPFPFLQSYCRRGIKECEHMLSQIRPDVIIVVQGMIELCVDILLAKRPSETRIISYIPIVQPMIETGAFIGGVRDLINRKVYTSFDAFITISQGQAKSLVDVHKVNAPIYVLNNLYANNKCLSFKIRKKKSYKILTVGRLDFQQKGLDRIPDIIKHLRARSIAFEWRIVGGGPGKRCMDAYAKKYQELSVVDWSDDVFAHYAWTDVVVSMARFEGISLVMLEAITAGKPFIGSDIISYNEYMPKTAIFKSAKDFPCCLLNVFHREDEMEEAFTQIQRKISHENSIESFTKSVMELSKWLPNIPIRYRL